MSDNKAAAGGDEGSAWGESAPAWGESGASAWGDSSEPAAAATPAALPAQEFPSLGDVKAVSSSTRKGNRAQNAFDSRGGSSSSGGRGRGGRNNLPRGPSGRSGDDGYGRGGSYGDDRGRGGYDREERRGGHNRDDYEPRGGHNRDDYGGRGGYDRDERRGGHNREDYDRGQPRYEVREKREVPDAPPFTAYVGNIPYDLPPADLCEWLGEECIITEVRMKRNKAYVDFEDRESLVKALSRDGESLGGRSIRMDVAEPPRSSGDGKVRDFSSLKNREMPTRSASPPRGGYDRSDYGGGRGGYGDRDRDRDGGFGGGGRGGRDFGARRAAPGPRPKKAFVSVKGLLGTDGDAKAAPRPSSIFGDAAPRDEAAAAAKLAKEREALKKKREEEREAKKAAAPAAAPTKKKDWGAVRSADRKPAAKKPTAPSAKKDAPKKEAAAPTTNAWGK
eukprot:TRINITY_DN1839_c0_g1_i5.p1 TRINITY_DN1839_c0_g1~~TRINITY_DN1839_c0_g1_i5.p1  ORF type:complete len:466 (-),score=-8.53 TRINITY_DN1839_c0_g1_i5:83-1426(-)